MKSGFLKSAFAAAVAVGTVSGSGTAEARRCRSNEQPVPKWGCVKKAEVRKATKTCSNLPKPAKFTQCLCQDGKTIGACGD
jgi:hypothetical protein